MRCLGARAYELRLAGIDGSREILTRDQRVVRNKPCCCATCLILGFRHPDITPWLPTSSSTDINRPTRRLSPLRLYEDCNRLLATGGHCYGASLQARSRGQPCLESIYWNRAAVCSRIQYAHQSNRVEKETHSRG